MKRFGKVFYSIHERFIIISVFLGMCSWILESFIHSYFFDKQYSNVISHILFPGAHEVWMRLTLVVMFISFGAYAQWIVVALKKAEREVQVANMELTQIFETSADGMRVIDKNFNVIRANKTFLHMSGLTSEEAVGKKCYEVFSGPACHTDSCPMIRIIKGEERIEHDEIKVNNNGKEIPCIVTATPFRGPDDQLIGVVENFKDISDRKQTEEQLQQSHKRLRDLASHLEQAREEERKRIARELHDELGQALTVLKMDIHWLAQRIQKDDQPTQLKMEAMSNLVDNTVHLVQRLLSELRPGLLDDLGLSAAIEWQANEFRDRLGIEFNIVSVPDDIKLSETCSTAIFRIFQETLTNIARHSKASKVEVLLTLDNDNVKLRVSDNGQGITKKQLTGANSLGLIGMRERIFSLNGTLEIKGDKNKGTIVSLSIPYNKGRAVC